MTATDGRTDTERMAETLRDIGLLAEYPERRHSIARRLIAQGVGHRDDILRAFAEYEMSPWLTILVDRHIASLAAKEKAR